MKEKKKALLTVLLAHLVLVISVMMLVLFVIDRVNEAMAFLNNDLTKWILAIFALAAAVLAITVIAGYERRRARERSGKRTGSKGEENESE